jgi:hypothetical protein
MFRKFQVLTAVWYALEEVVHNGGELPGRQLKSLYRLARQYNKSITPAEYDEIVSLPLKEIFEIDKLNR